MKKLLFVLFMVLSGQVVAAQEIVLNYSLPAGGSVVFQPAYNSGCLPTVLSLESGNVNTATWLVVLGTHASIIKVVNIGTATEYGAAKLRIDVCNP